MADNNRLQVVNGAELRDEPFWAQADRNLEAAATLNVDPDRSAQSQELAREMFVPTPFADRNAEILRRGQERARRQQTLQNSPLLTSYLENPNVASIARDSVDGLAQVEEQWRRNRDEGFDLGRILRATPSLMLESVYGMEQSLLEDPATAPLITGNADLERAAISGLMLVDREAQRYGLPRVLSEEQSPTELRPTPILRDTALGTAQGVAEAVLRFALGNVGVEPSEGAGYELAENPDYDPAARSFDNLTIDDLPEGDQYQERAAQAATRREAVAEQAQELLPEGRNIVETGVISGVSSLFSQAPYLAAGILTRSPSVGLAGVTGSTYGTSYGRARDAGLEPQRAREYARWQSDIEAATELFPVANLIGDIAQGSGFLRTVGRQMVADIPGEQAATLGQDFVDWRYLNPEATFADYLAERPEAAAVTLIATIVQSGSMGGISQIPRGAELLSEVITNTSGTTATERSTEQLIEMRERIEQTPLFTRQRQAVRDFIEMASDGETVYLEADGVEKLFQSDQDTFSQLVESLELSESQILEAMDGVDITVPVSALQTIEDRAVFESALDITRRDENTYSPRQLREMVEADRIPEEYFDLLDDVDQELADIQEYEHIERTVREQLVQAGRSPQEAQAAGAIWGAMFRRLQDAGIDERQVFEQLGLSIQREGRQRRAPRQPQTLTDFVRRQGGIREAFGDGLTHAGGEIRQITGSSRKLINNRRGQTIDNLARAARDAGFNIEEDDQSFLDALDRDFNGEPVFRIEDEGPYREALAAYEANRTIEAEDVLEQASAQGYEGNDIGEAQTWLNAVAKGLDMSTEARMARAQEMGFDTEQVLYHGTDSGGFAKFNEGRYGIFFSTNRNMAESYYEGLSGTELSPMNKDGFLDYVKGQYEYSVDDFGSEVEVEYDGYSARAETEDAAIMELVADGGIEIKFQNQRGGDYGTYSVYGRLGRSKVIDFEGRNWDDSPFGTTDDIALEASAQGYDSVIIKNVFDNGGNGNGTHDGDVTIIFDPKNIRSVAAAFDPDASDSANLLAQFAGPQAETADIHALANAKDLIASGRNPEQVRQETGWFRGPDGKWRYEISDDEAVLRVTENFDFSRSYQIADILEHEKLFAAYPDIRLIPVEFDSEMDANGMVDAEGMELFLNPSKLSADDGSMLSTLLHEIQHLIQRREGFARGGNLEVTSAIRSALREVLGREERAVQEYRENNADKFEAARQARNMVGYAYMYKDYYSLIEYANMNRPSGVFRHIRNATQWLHTPILRDGAALQEEAADLYRELYMLPKRGDKRNVFLRDYSFKLAQLLKKAVPVERWQAMEADERQTRSMLNALERESRKARYNLRKYEILKDRKRLAKDQADAVTELSPFEIYQRLAGEVEARNTQNRQDMTEDERRASSPESTQTVDKNNMITGEAKKERIGSDEVFVVMQDMEVRSPMLANAGGETLFQKERAYVQIPGALGPTPGAGVLSDEQVIVRLTEAADKTSFMHESAHIFLEVYAALESKSPEIADQMKGLREWLDWKQGDPLTRDQHEKFAGLEGFEGYLTSGKAPSAELKSVFRVFRQWFLDVYKALKGRLIRLDPRAREFFDKMLASREDVEMARSEFASRAARVMSDIMTPEQVEKYQKQAELAGQVAQDKLFREHLQAIDRRTGRVYKRDKRRVEGEVREELKSAPVYRAMDAGNIDPVSLAEIGGEDAAVALARFTAEDGDHAEIVAADSGFTSADEMIGAMMEAIPFEDAVSIETEHRMLMLYPEMNREDSYKKAIEEVFNDPSIRRMEVERDALAAKAARDAIPLEAIRRRADQMISAMPIDEVIKPGRYAIKARDLHKKSIRLAAREQWEDALRTTHQAMLNHELARRAYKARDEVEVINRFLSKFGPTRSAYRKRIANEYIEPIMQLISLPGSDNQFERMEALRKFADEQIADNQMVVLPTEVVADRPLPMRRKMTMDQLREYRDSVQTIYNLGKGLSEQAKAERTAYHGGLAEQIRTAWGDKNGPSYSLNPNAGEKIAKFARDFDSSNLALPYIVESFQGDKRGDVADVLYNDLAVAQSAVEERLQALEDGLVEILDRYDISQKELNQRLSVKELDANPLTKQNLFALLLNMGNAGNKNRVENDPSHGLSAEQVLGVLESRLEKRHFDAAQEIWDLIETQKPDLGAVHKRRTGVAPKWVDAEKFQTKYGTYRGGYYPISYDRSKPQNSDLKEQDTEDLFKQFSQGTASRAQTKSGMLQERVNNAERPLDLRLNVLLKHFQDTAMLVEMSEPIDKAWQVISSRQVGEALADTHGIEYTRAVKTILKRTAGGGAAVDESAAINAINPILRTFRVNAAVAILGWNVRTAFLAPISYAQTVFPRYGRKVVMRGMMEFFGNPAKAVSTMEEKSVFMRERARTLNREAYDRLQRKVREGSWSKVQGSGYWLMQFVEKYSVSGPLWHGVYVTSLEQGLTEKQAVAEADKAVGTTQGSGRVMDQTVMQSSTNELVRTFTFMMGYVSRYYGVVRNDVAKAKGLRKSIPIVRHLIIMNLAASMMEAVLRTNWTADDDEDDSYFDNVGKMFARNITGLLPFVGPFFSKYDSGPAVTQFGTKAIASVEDVGGLIFSGEADADMAIRTAETAGEAIGFGLGVPGTLQLRQIERTLMHDDDPEVLEAILTGPDDD